MTVSTHKRWAAVDAAATATITVADGDDNTNGQFTEGTTVAIESHDGTRRIYVLCDGSESGASATGTVLTAGSDTGASTLSAATAARGTCVAFQNNLNTHTQALVLNELKAAIVHANGHNGKITAGADVSGDGSKSIVFTQATAGAQGNTRVDSDISTSLVTVTNFSGGSAEGDKKNRHTVAAGGTAGGYNITANIKSNIDLVKGRDQSGSKVVLITGSAHRPGVEIAFKDDGGTLAYNPNGRAVTRSSTDTGFLIRGGTFTKLSGKSSTEHFLSRPGSDTTSRRGGNIHDRQDTRRYGDWSDTIFDIYSGAIKAADGAAKSTITNRGGDSNFIDPLTAGGATQSVDSANTSKKTAGEFVILGNFVDWTTGSESGHATNGTTNLVNYSSITG